MKFPDRNSYTSTEYLSNYCQVLSLFITYKNTAEELDKNSTDFLSIESTFTVQYVLSILLR